MKKLILLIFIPLVSFGQITAKEYYLNGNEKIKNGDYEGAINDFSSYLKIMNDEDKEGDYTWDLLTAVYGKEDVASAYYNRGLAKDNLSLFEGAIADYTLAIKLNNSYTNAYINRAVVNHKIENFNAAINDFTKAIKINPNIPQPYWGRSLSKYYLSDFKGACEDARKSEILGLPFPEMIEDACK